MGWWEGSYLYTRKPAAGNYCNMSLRIWFCSPSSSSAVLLKIFFCTFKSLFLKNYFSKFDSYYCSSSWCLVLNAIHVILRHGRIYQILVSEPRSRQLLRFAIILYFASWSRNKVIDNKVVKLCQAWDL